MQIKGTFLDEISHDIPHQNWGEKEWDADFGYMHRAGIEHVILIRCGYRPDIVVIKLGSNDFSTGIAPAEKPFNDSYARAIDYLRSIWGQVPILCVAPSDNTVVLRYLEQLIAERQDANLHFTAILPGVTNWDSDMGANYHPNHHGHRKLAMSVIPYIATITGWELPDTSVE